MSPFSPPWGGKSGKSLYSLEQPPSYGLHSGSDGVPSGQLLRKFPAEESAILHVTQLTEIQNVR